MRRRPPSPRRGPEPGRCSPRCATAGSPTRLHPGGTLFETVAEEVFDRYGRRWKPRTLEVNRVYLRRQILPFFAGRPIGEISREDVQAWFRGLHATPAAANRSAPILSVIMQQAEAWGYRPENSNPCAGIRRYRQGRSERFLTPEEYRRLACSAGPARGRPPPARGRRAPAAAHRVPQVGDPDPPMALLPGGAALSARQQDRAAHGLAVCEAARGVLDQSAPVVRMGLPGRRSAHPVAVAGLLLAAA